MKRKILWILTGGTFSCIQTNDGLVPSSSDEQAKRILSLMPEITAENDVTPLVLMNTDSSDMTAKEHKEIADAVDKHIREYDGIVITHGTDTMAFTAAALSVIIKNPPVPIVLTGSQQPFFAKDGDARQNFADSFAVAGKSGSCGIFVVFGGRILNGSDCTKIDTVSFDAFRSVQGDVGKISDGEIKINVKGLTGKSGGEYSFDSSLCLANGRIAVLDMHPSFNPKIISALYDMGIIGYVIRCYGAGGMPERVRTELGKVIAKGAKATAVTQCLYGGASLDIYAVGTAAERAGIKDGGYMTTEYAAALMAEQVAKLPKP